MWVSMRQLELAGPYVYINQKTVYGVCSASLIRFHSYMICDAIPAHWTFFIMRSTHLLVTRTTQSTMETGLKYHVWSRGQANHAFFLFVYNETHIQ